MQKVSCIIPAYNEKDRISLVLQVVSGHSLISEIVVVDDGSKDGTGEEVKKFKDATLITHEVNRGKSMSVYDGISRSTGDYILLLDSDLVGLNPKNITDLITPILNNEADISLSLRQNSPWWSKMFGLDFISGERVFHRDLLKEDLDEIPKITGYGLEVFINKIVLRKISRIKIVFWKEVRFTYKVEKIGWFKGILGEILMILEIINAISIIGNIRMYFGMLGLRVK